MKITRIWFVEKEEVPGFGYTSGTTSEVSEIRANAFGVTVRKIGHSQFAFIPWPRLRNAHAEDEPVPAEVPAKRGPGRPAKEATNG